MDTLLSDTGINSLGLPFHGLPKEERIFKKRIIDLLFDKTSPSFSQYPLRVVYRVLSEEEGNLQSAHVSILFSVSKRHFKRAVKRNRVKRQLREAYRLQKTILTTAVQQKEIKLAIAFLWLSGDLWESSKIALKMQQILDRLVTRLTSEENPLPENKF